MKEAILTKHSVRTTESIESIESQGGCILCPDRLMGTARDGDSIYVPSGLKSDWNLVLTPALIGRSEGSDEKNRDNAILEYYYEVDSDQEHDNRWVVKVDYRYRTGYDKPSSVEWFNDGIVNYTLIPKYANDLNTGEQIEVSRLETIKPETAPITLVPPDQENNWLYLLIPFRIIYKEESDDDNADNAVIGWDWNFKQELEVDPYYWYRKLGSDSIKKVYDKFKVLWVRQEFAHLDDAKGEHDFTNPSGDSDQAQDEWMVVSSPLTMGIYESNEDPYNEKRTLIMMENFLSRTSDFWAVDAEYLWCDNESDASTVYTQNGRVECLFIAMSLLF